MENVRHSLEDHAILVSEGLGGILAQGESSVMDEGSSAAAGQAPEVPPEFHSSMTTTPRQRKKTTDHEVHTKVGLVCLEADSLTENVTLT